ncbi:related to SPC3-signal peptidase subunit [Serendipita indica DSM 11827]|uniref:Signal peptidase subunit 3 n=1 Tax=Serendipita indica (strain DSM 11827) TaxID=1109443 RepID=G4TI68_SERID|nr:related to SPC3-signal peptidase subunit [Serendipita indica DSM 11827]
MYSSLQRLNNLSTFVTTCTLALLAAISLSSFLLATTPTGELNVSPVQMYDYLILRCDRRRRGVRNDKKPPSSNSLLTLVRLSLSFPILILFDGRNGLTTRGLEPGLLSRLAPPTCKLWSSFDCLILVIPPCDNDGDDATTTITDLRPLFHWNTKQVFLYLCAEYTNGKGGSQLDNEVVIWDRIVRRRQDARIRIENGQNKYYFKEHSGNFRNVSEAQFTLKYNVMPYVGPLTYGEGGRTKSKVQFPKRT